jgi:hypothetical protein
VLPLSLRQNNPGNLRPTPTPWLGQVGAQNGFCVFDTMVHGVRALAKNLLAYQDLHGIRTVRQAISRWAPSGENATGAYIAFVCTVCCVEPDDKLDFHDVDTLFWLVTAIGEQEAGHAAFTQNVSDADLDAGVHMALGIP